MNPHAHSPAPALRAGGLAALLVGLPVAALLAVGAVAPVDLLLPGRRGPSAALIRRDFPGARFRNEVGFDGQQYYALARFFPRLDRAAPYLDDPQVRAQRVLLPAIGRIGGRGDGIVYAFAAAGVLGVALAVGALADILAAHGHDPRLGYAALPPLLVPLLLSTPEPLGYGLALAGCAAALRGRALPAAGAFAAAALTRESAAIVAAATALELARRRRWRSALACALPPAAAFAAWQAAVRHLLGHLARPYAAQLRPLGLLAADPVNLTLALVAVAAFAVVAWRWRTVPVLAITTAAFGAALLALAPRNLGPLALTRTMAPAEMAALAALAAAVSGRRRDAGPS